MISTRRRLDRFVALLLALATAGCAADGSTRPPSVGTAPFDAARVHTDAATLAGALSATAWRQLAVLGSMSSASASSVPGDRSGGLRTTRRLNPAVLGTTYALDPSAMRYVPAPGRTGAPADGVRFILYAVDTATHSPIPTQETGYADLHDLGASVPQGFLLHLVAVSGGVTFLDYSLQTRVDSGGAGGGGLEAGGAIGGGGGGGGGGQVMFHMQAQDASTPGGGSASSVAFQFAIPERSFSVSAQLAGIQAAGGQNSASHIELDVQSQATAINYDITGDQQNVSAGFRVNGQLFATVTGSNQNPDVRSATGQPLSADQAAALGQLMQLAGSVFDAFGNLMQPLNAIMALSAMT